MTPAQREQLNRFLAERVLGWMQDDYGWLDKDGLIIGVTVREGRPGLPNFTQSWADCEPLLNKIEHDNWCWKMGFIIFNSDRWYWFEMEKYDRQYRPTYKLSNQPTSTEALCLAIARAYGWKE